MASRLKQRFIRSMVVLGAVLLLAAGYSYRWYRANFNYSNVISDTAFIIKRNMSGDDVISFINNSGFLRDTNNFRQLASIKNYNGVNVVAGKYKIKHGWSSNELINHLRAGNGRLESIVRFRQQRDLKQLSAVLSQDILLDSTTIYKWLNDPKNQQQYGFNEYNMICMFIPNTYYVYPDVTVDELMERMKLEYDRFWTTERTKKAEATGLSKTGVITLASIVYWETNKEKDMPTIAGVYINRLKRGMALQADPTLIFATGDYSIKRVLDKHKEIESPYNTYKYAGLPPGPIIIPPIKYIDAVLNYEQHDYMYFVAKEDFSGYSYFAKTYREHLMYAARYHRALNRRGIRR